MRLNDTDINLYGFKVSMVMSLPSDSSGGKTSSTADVDSGIKPKLLNCTGFAAKKDYRAVQEIVAMAEALDSTGNRIVYDIVDDTARVSNIRRVKFFDNVSITEDEQYKKWKVAFTLKEKDSVAESKLKQENNATVAVQGESGSTTETPTPSDTPTGTGQALGGKAVSDIESFLSIADEWLGSAFGANDASNS